MIEQEPQLVAMLLEMGYAPDTKAASGQTPTALRALLLGGVVEVKVGDSAEMVLVGGHTLHDCQYPLIVAVELFKVGRNFTYATLVRSCTAPKLPVWFMLYNARQTIEAGTKI